MKLILFAIAAVFALPTRDGYKPRANQAQRNAANFGNINQNERNNPIFKYGSSAKASGKDAALLATADAMTRRNGYTNLEPTFNGLRANQMQRTLNNIFYEEPEEYNDDEPEYYDDEYDEY